MRDDGGGGPYVVTAGLIGAGKTSLASALQQRLGISFLPEPVDGNPYLERFYNDMPTWSFHLHIYNLWSRATQVKQAASRPGGSISDRSIYEDRLFVDVALTSGVTSVESAELFVRLADLVESSLPRPAGLIYVTAPIDVCLRRIASRGRRMEQAIDASYLESLQLRYERWIAGFTLAPVLLVNSVDHDLRNPETLPDELLAAVTRMIGRPSDGSSQVVD